MLQMSTKRGVTRRGFLEQSLVGLAGLAALTNPSIAYSQSTNKDAQEFLEKYNDLRPEKTEYIQTTIKEGKNKGKKEYQIEFLGIDTGAFKEDHVITLDYHVTNDQESRTSNPHIGILTPFRNETRVERKLALGYAFDKKGGIPTYVIEGPEYLFALVGKVDDANNLLDMAGVVKHINRVYEQYLFDAMQSIDLMSQRPELKGGRIGITGNSLAGMGAASLSAIRDDISSTVLMTTGMGLGDILATSTYPLIKEARENLAKRMGDTSNPFSSGGNFLKLDPLYLFQDIDPETTYMVFASDDTVIPKGTTHDMAREIFGVDEIGHEIEIDNLIKAGKLFRVNGTDHISIHLAAAGRILKETLAFHQRNLLN